MVIDVLNEKINERGIPVSELARRVGLDPELLRRSLAGSRNLKAEEFVNLCHELKLGISAFSNDQKSEES